MKNMQTASSHSRFSIRHSLNEKNLSIGPHPISPQDLTRTENPPIFEEPDEGKEEVKTMPFLEHATLEKVHYVTDLTSLIQNQIMINSRQHTSEGLQFTGSNNSDEKGGKNSPRNCKRSIEAGETGNTRPNPLNGSSDSIPLSQNESAMNSQKVLKGDEAFTASVDSIKNKENIFSARKPQADSPWKDTPHFLKAK
jgi:hypothetical protein